MGVESKHAYRFQFLKSEEWKTLRLQILARSNARCFICSERKLDNDIHHVFYRCNWRDTKASDCYVLCRNCHDEVHSALNYFVGQNRTRKEMLKEFHKIAYNLRNRLRPKKKKPSDYLREAYQKVCSERDELRKRVQELEQLLDSQKTRIYLPTIEQSGSETQIESVKSDHFS